MSAAPDEVGGPHGLLAALQELHAEAGRPSSRTIATAVGISSHSTIAELLRGKRTPTWDLLRRVVLFLGGDEDRFRTLLEESKDNQLAFPSGGDLDFIKDYRGQVDLLVGRSNLPGLERRTVVSLKETFITPHIHNDQGELPLSSFVPAIRRAVLLGEPGGGKTTTATFIVQSYAQLLPSYVAFMVRLRSWDARETFEEQIESHLKSDLQLRPPEDFVFRALQSGKSLVVFDGLDEVLDRRHAVAAIEAFVNKFEKARVLVTSRAIGYEQTRLDPSIFDSFGIAPFDTAQQVRFVESWFAAAGEDAVTSSQAAKAILQKVEVRAVVSNPLMLAMFCSSYQDNGYVPRNQVETIASYVELYLDRWDRLRGLSFPGWTGVRLQRFLEEAAFRLDVYALESLRETDVLEVLDDLIDRAGDSRSDALESLMNRAGLFVQVGRNEMGERIFSFAARAVREYFVARAICRRYMAREALAEFLVSRIDAHGVTNIELFVLDIARNAFEDQDVSRLVKALRQNKLLTAESAVRLDAWMAARSAYGTGSHPVDLA